jgi:hypothetical protein
MTDLLIRPEALEIAVTAFKRGGSESEASFRERMEEKVGESIAAFCEAEGLTVERMDRNPNNPAEDWIPEQRLVGPWREVKGEGR